MRTAIALILVLVPVGAAATPVDGTETVELVVDASAGVWRQGSDGRPVADTVRRLLLGAACRLAGADEPPAVRLRWMGGDPGATADGCLAVDDTAGVDPGDPVGIAGVLDLRPAGGPRPLIRAIEAAAATAPRRIVVLATGLDGCGFELGDISVPDGTTLEIFAVEVRPGGLAELPEGLTVRPLAAGAGAAEALAAALLGAEPPRASDAELEVAFQPAAEDAVVTVTGTLGGQTWELYRRRDGSWRTRVPPGPYRLDATDGATVVEVADLLATSGGQVLLDLGPSPRLDLEVATDPASATGTLAFRVWGRTDAPLWLAVVREDAPSDDFTGAVRLPPGGRDSALRVPDLAGPAELRAHLELPSGARRLAARARLLVRPAVAELSAPGRSETGTPLQLGWKGPEAPGDRVTVAAADAPAGDFDRCLPVGQRNDATLTTPASPGPYEVRYVSGLSGRMLGRVPFEVFEILARLDAPDRVGASDSLEVAWEGPGEAADFVTVVRPDAPPGAYRRLALVAGANPVRLRAPDEPGDWQVRYVDGATGETLGHRPLEVAAAAPTLDAPATVRAGDRFEIRWTGPDRGGDLIVVARAGAPDRRWEEFGYTTAGSPVDLAAPFSPGAYEIRYVDGASGEVMARRPLQVR